MSSSPVQPIRPAATVIIARDADSGAGGIEIFMLRRTSQAAFAGGMYVFPGGKVESDDHLHVLDPWRRGPTEGQQRQVAALGNEWRGYWIAAIRETFEEAGLLLAYTEDGQMLDWRDRATEARFRAYRNALNRGELDLLDLCREEGLRLACDHVHFFNRWVTPLGRPRRFDTRFFIAEAPWGQNGVHDTTETVHSVWVSPKVALAEHAAGAFGLMGVTQRQLASLEGFGSVAELHQWALAQERFPTFRPVLPKGG
ncbi:MAG: NUDIX domain-containing protein [Gammaproteobacteria bacterium]|nr:NUDIX domain-containing protein [Gammaproteobacteria bacterium]